jgi:hypothetical protein
MTCRRSLRLITCMDIGIAVIWYGQLPCEHTIPPNYKAKPTAFMDRSMNGQLHVQKYVHIPKRPPHRVTYFVALYC